MYLIINRIDGSVEEKNGNKCLNIADTVKNNEKYKSVFNEIKHHINKIDGSDVEYDKDYMKIKFYSDDIPLNKVLYFPTITVIIRCVFEKNSKYYPQFYLDECLYQV